MSTLTKQEKDALEDVFLSIHTGNNKYKKLKELSSFIIADEISSVLSKSINLLLRPVSQWLHTGYH